MFASRLFNLLIDNIFDAQTRHYRLMQCYRKPIGIGTVGVGVGVGDDLHGSVVSLEDGGIRGDCPRNMMRM